MKAQTLRASSDGRFFSLYFCHAPPVPAPSGLPLGLTPWTWRKTTSSSISQHRVLYTRYSCACLGLLTPRSSESQHVCMAREAHYLPAGAGLPRLIPHQQYLFRIFYFDIISDLEKSRKTNTKISLHPAPTFLLTSE